MNLARILDDAARQHPQRPAVRLDDLVITYAQLDDLSARAADWLRERGVAPGDRVGIMLPNLAQFPVLYYGVLRAGGEAFEGVGLVRQSGQTVARYVIDDDLLFSDIASDDAGKGGDGLGHRGYPFRSFRLSAGSPLTRRPSQLIKRRKLRRGDQDDDGREPYGRTVRHSARRPGRPPGPAHPSRNEKRYHACKRQWPGLTRPSTVDGVKRFVLERL